MHDHTLSTTVTQSNTSSIIETHNPLSAGTRQHIIHYKYETQQVIHCKHTSSAECSAQPSCGARTVRMSTNRPCVTMSSRMMFPRMCYRCVYACVNMLHVLAMHQTKDKRCFQDSQPRGSHHHRPLTPNSKSNANAYFRIATT